MTLPPQALVDIGTIIPPRPRQERDKALNRFDLALDKALRTRAPQAAVTKLVNDADHEVLNAAGHNMRMRLLAGLRPEEKGTPAPEDTQFARMRLYAGLRLDEPFLDKSRKLGHRIAGHFIERVNSPDLQADWAARDADSRLDMIVDLMHAYGHESGYPPVARIESDEIPPDENNRIQTGEYRPDTDTHWQNTHKDAGWEDAVEALTIATHEATHKMQQGMMIRLMGELRPDLVDMPSGMEPFDDDADRVAAWYFMDNNMFGHITTGQQEIGYKNQPIEVHARLVEDAFRQTMNRRLVLGLEDGVITGVTMDDLAELGIDMDTIRTDSQPPKRRLI